MILPVVLLILALAIVGHGFVTGRSFTARAAAIGARTSRGRMLIAWAAGIWASYGLSSLIGLILLDRSAAIVAFPPEFRPFASTFGVSGEPDRGMLLYLAGCLATGLLLGFATLAFRRRLGRKPIGLKHRSIGAAQSSRERLPAALLSLSAGLSEELFFRLFLPLLVAIVFGSAGAGFAVGLVAFVLAHRHQKRAGMIAVGIVGAALTALYLLTGMLWAAIVLHIVIDLNALIVRPWLSGNTRD